MAGQCYAALSRGSLTLHDDRRIGLLENENREMRGGIEETHWETHQDFANLKRNFEDLKGKLGDLGRRFGALEHERRNISHSADCQSRYLALESLL